MPNIEALEARRSRRSTCRSRRWSGRSCRASPRWSTALPVGAVVKMVVGESRNFPELAKVWHDEVVLQGARP